MEIHVLGRLRVQDGDRRIDLGGPKQRTVLALLVASVGRVVPTDVLLMETYGPDVDPAVRRSLQTWISRFRRELGATIEHRGDGYVLDIDLDVVDAHRFEESVTRARTLKNDALAAETLNKALEMWHDRPYSDVEPTATIAAESRRLEGLWDEAIDRRISLDLSAGRHRALVPELETLVMEHPHHEQLRAHHMTALYRCGRQADALRSFRDAEERLRSELGIDPSPALRDLELRILNQDHALDYRPMARLRPVPSRFSTFIGRDFEVSEVTDLVRRHRLVTITGPGGVGKSSLGVEVVKGLADEYPTAFAPMESQRDEGPWRIIASSLGIPADSGSPEHVVEMIGEEPVVLLLDGCEHRIGKVAEVATEMLSACRNVRLVVTSREPLATPGEQIFRLDPLDDGMHSTSNRLFMERAGISESNLELADLDRVTAIGSRLSGLPLAIELAAARARTLTLREITERLDDQLPLLATKRGPVPHQRSMASAIEWSYELLEPDAQATFRNLGAFPTGSIPLDAAAAVLGTSSPTDELAPLIEASLVTRSEDRPAGYRILEPIRQYAQLRLNQTGEFEAARLRHAEWVAQLCERAHLDYLRGDLGICTQTLSTHAASIAATARWAVDTGHPEVTLKIIAGAGRRWPHVAAAHELIDPGLLALEADQDSIPADVRLRALAHLSFLHTPYQRERALQLLHQLAEQGDRAEGIDLLTQQIVASVRASVAVREEVGRWVPPEQTRDGMYWLDRSIELAERLGYPAEPHLYNRALMLENSGDLVESRATLERILSWAGDEHPVMRALALHVLAVRQSLDGEKEDAVQSAREAARLFVEWDDLDFAAEAESMLAAIHADRGGFPEAQEAVGRFDDYHRQIGLLPLAEDDPGLDAQVAAGLDEWDRFLESGRRFVNSIPPVHEPSAREAFLVGLPGHISRVSLLVLATVRFLVLHDAPDVAGRLIASLPHIARAAPNPEVYASVGILDEAERLGTELGLADSDDPIETAEDAFACIRSVVEGNSASPD